MNAPADDFDADMTAIRELADRLYELLPQLTPAELQRLYDGLRTP